MQQAPNMIRIRTAYYNSHYIVSVKRYDSDTTTVTFAGNTLGAGDRPTPIKALVSGSPENFVNELNQGTWNFD